MTERIPPRSHEREADVLCAMLQDEQAAAGLAATLSADAFDYEPNRLTFLAATRCVTRGDPCNIRTVGEELDRQGKLLEVTGAYLGRLVEGPPLGSWMHCAQSLKALAERRKIIRAGERIALMGYANQETVKEYRERAEAILFQATQAGQTSDILTPAHLAATLDRNQPALALSVGLSIWDAPAPILAEGRLVVLAGRPNIGKTAQACGILARHALAVPPVPCLFLSLEQTGREIAERILALRSGRTLYETQTDPHPWDVEKLAASGLYLSEAGAPSLTTILGMIRAARASYGIRLVVLDHIGKVSGGRKETRTLEVGDVARGLKAIAKDLHIPILALCQLNRAVEGRDIKRPHLSDLRESGEIEQEADAVIFLWSGESTIGKAQISISMTLAKNRHGPTGEMRAAFDRPRLRFTEDR
jgi:replicative DNA helicase